MKYRAVHINTILENEELEYKRSILKNYCTTLKHLWTNKNRQKEAYTEKTPT